MSDCWFWQVECRAEEAAEKVAENVVMTWGRSVMEALDKCLLKVGTYWVDIETPDVSAEDSPTKYVIDSTAWLAGAILVGGLMMAGIYLMWSMRGEEIRKILSGVLRMIIISGAAVTVAQLAIGASDDIAKWFISEAADGMDGTFATRLISIDDVSMTQVGWFMIILGGIVGIIANLIQIGLMEVRGAILPLVVGMIPMAAAAAVTDWGRQWLSKMIGWTVAFITMKPAAAIVYGTAIKMVTMVDSKDQLGNFIRGVILMVLAAVALPALIKLIVPAAAGVAAGIGGSGAAAAGAGALASGAMPVSRSGGAAGSGSSGAGGGGAAGPETAGGAAGGSESAGSGSAGGSESAGSGAAGGSGSAGSGSAGGSGSSGSGMSGGAADGEMASGAAGTETASGAGGSGAAGGAAGGSGAAGGGGAAGAAAAVVMVGARGAQAGVQAAQSAGEQSSGADEVAR